MMNQSLLMMLLSPKFHKGEWIVFNGLTLYVKVVVNGFYITISKGGIANGYDWDIDNLARLWTIQDARDGDVLFDGSNILLFKEVNHWHNVTSYLAYSQAYSIREYFVSCSDVIIPATEEQRDLLFQKMKEVGYIWDDDKKELRKIVDNVKPKFHVGDWIISDAVDKDYHICKITGIKDGNYTIESTYGYKGHNQFDVFDNSYRLWTIKDAKDGDVLFLDLMCGKTFIYNGINPGMAILYSFIINNDGKDVLPYHIGKPNTGIGTVEENKNIIHPATKEQRDLLFQKMKDAVYGILMLSKNI